MKARGTLSKSEVARLQRGKFVQKPDKRRRKGKSQTEYPEAKHQPG